MTHPATFVSKKGASKWRLRLTPVVYAKLSAQEVTFKNINNGKIFKDEPIMALSTGRDGHLIEGIGHDARAVATVLEVTLRNPLAHPRSIVSDITLTERLLQYGFMQVKSRWTTRAPVVILHPQGPFEGGLTEVEVHVMQELAIAAGASHVQVWDGRELTDQEIRASPTLFAKYAMFRPGLPTQVPAEITVSATGKRTPVPSEHQRAA